MHDVAIIGAGPAGLAVARSLADRGVDCVVIAPPRTWHATYGAWRDDVDKCELGAPIATVARGQWSTVRVVGRREHRVARPYVVFDNDALRASLAANLSIVGSSVVSVEHSLDASTVRIEDGTSLVARLVIDATGNGDFLARIGRAIGAQTAYGLVVSDTPQELSNRFGIEPDVFTLMDWSTPPTFLYAARFPDTRLLIEETSLYAEPPHEIDDLRRRLSARLGDDLTTAAVAVERVNIAMGAPLPSRSTRVVGFGAAAGFVHPVTGYSVAASLRAAPRVADALAAALAARRFGAELSQTAWQAVWPSRLVQTRRWHDVGLAALRAMPAATIPSFFDAFFELPTELGAAYLRVDSDPRAVRAAMLGVFRRVDNATRLRLMSSPASLLRALVAR